jgi:hypothetical protein
MQSWDRSIQVQTHMPSLSWNQIRANAVAFSKSWADATREQADKQSFWTEFFQIFGIPLRTVASFEEPVRRLRGTYGFIDLLWKGKLLVEHKSAGASLDAAETQAFDYIQGLFTTGRGDEVPRYVVVSDFQRFALYDLEPDEQLDLPLFRARFRYTRTDFDLADLQHHIREFAFIPGYQVATSKPHDQLNLKAVNLMTGVHDELKRGGYTGHDLERLLVRILFCLFGQSTGIFEQEAFRLYIENRTHPDGNDLGRALNELFAVLDTPKDRRQHNLDETLQSFDYINGALFTERLDYAAFDGPMRKSILEAANFDWSRISPAIFGALFQEVMTDTDRRKIGAHYTSERDILKVIHPLFLDKLREEFTVIDKDRSGRRPGRLEAFRVRLTQLKFLDPACGCGNFLVIAYRELRALELDVLRAQHAGQQAFTLDEVNRLSQVDVHQLYGIEIEEWPARIAEVALWLMDHQSNLRILEAFSQPFVRLPLRNSPHIHIGNALRMDWNDLLPPTQCSYILGNPPFIGKNLMSKDQKADILSVVGEVKGNGVLDFVTAWYFKAANYISSTSIPVAFVSTNSISQGEQVGVLWQNLLERHGIQIQFAYRTFAWTSEARGMAHVHVVIIGFSSPNTDPKLLFDFVPKTEQMVAETVLRISPYLFEGSDRTLRSRTNPIGDAPPIVWGNMPNDGGFLILNKIERAALLRDNPELRPYIRPFLGGYEFINGEERFCLWLEGASPSICGIPEVKRRLEGVRDTRLKSKRATTRQLAYTPSIFGEIRQPQHRYLAIPEVSSERRPYIPMAFLPARVICSNKLQTISGATLYHLGILASAIHMSWVKQVCGRLESRYNYSGNLVYNNYPWPQSPTAAQHAAVEREAQAVLDARALYPDSTLAQLYDPLLMPPELVHAHQRLDRAVEKCYRPQPFASDRERVEFLFALYEQLTAPLLPAPPAPRRRRKSGSAKTNSP